MTEDAQLKEQSKKIADNSSPAGDRIHGRIEGDSQSGEIGKKPDRRRETSETTEHRGPGSREER